MLSLNQSQKTVRLLWALGFAILSECLLSHDMQILSIKLLHHKSIAAFWNSFDAPPFITFVERLSQAGYIHAQISFFDKRIGPDFFQ